MTTLPRWFVLFALLVVPLLGQTDNDTAIAAVRKQDDARVAAMMSADRAALEAIFSDGLNYAHSSGTVVDKPTYIAALTNGQRKYTSITFDERKFRVAAPDIVLVTGRCRMKSVMGGQPTDLHINFLGVWRLENGIWRFFSWQACHLAT